MKNYLNRVCFLCLACAAMISCNKEFLNIVPQGQQVATTTNDYALIMNDAGLAQYTSGGGWQSAMIMGDEIAAESDYFNNMQRVSQAAFRWEDDITKFGDIDFASRNWLSNLYILNKVINEVEASTGGSEEQKQSIKAEAQANRAFIYLQLINLYGKPYVATTAATDPGFPVITSADITVTSFNRSSVQAVYDFIVKDFKDAIASLPVNNVNGIRFNKSGAEALLGKAYLFMGMNNEALDVFNAAFADNAARSVPARLYNYNEEFAAGGKFDPIGVEGPANSPGLTYLDFTESVVSKVFYNGPYNGNGFSNDAFVLTPAARDLFAASDLRLNFYAPEFPYQIINPSGRLRKYAVLYTQFGMQISELYLLRAEVRARLNDLSGAKEDLEVLRKNRMPATDATVPADISTQNALIRYVFDERIREFAMEGYRWFDMRRESTDPVFSGRTYTHTIFNNDDNTITTLSLRPVRLTLKLPYSISSMNPNLPDNP